MGRESGEWVLVGGERPQLRAATGKGWSKAKEREFLWALAETCNVTLAAAEAGLSSGVVYRRRKTDAAFRGAWMEAIGVAYQRLEMVLLERAFVGTEKIVRRKDGNEERMVEYPNQLALTLLKMHRDTAIASAPENEPDNIEEIRERLFNKLERLKAREAKRGAAE